MKHSTEPDNVPGLRVFEKSCLYCGARFRVLASHLSRQDVPEAYACPECGKHYEIESAALPEVQLLKPRTDGKHDRYQETMF
jgi:DNA-directed RNA polymerase subunit RPC12/RpoP